MRRQRRTYGGGSAGYASFVVIFCWLVLLLETTTVARLGNAAATFTTTTTGDTSNKTKDDLDCNCLWEQERKEQQQQEQQHQYDEDDDDDERLVRIAYLITVHNNVTADDAVALVRSIVAPWVRILIHVDVKMNFEKEYKSSSLHQLVSTCPCGAHITVHTVHDAKWSTWSMNLPTLWAMETLVGAIGDDDDDANGTNSRHDDWDVFINLSGDTLPVLKPAKLRHALSAMRGITFLTSSACTTGLLPTSVHVFPTWWHKRGHYMPEWSAPEDYVLTYTDYTRQQQRTLDLEIYFGSQWMTLGRDVVTYIVQELQRPDSLASQLKNWLVEKEKLMTDETFFPTLLMHTPHWNTTLPQVNEEDDWRLILPSNSSIPYPSDLSLPTDLRFERMDEHVPTAFGETWPNQRYDVPAQRSKASRPKPWGPYFLGVYDLHAIRASGALFVRKVSSQVDPNLVALLPVSKHTDLPNIHWPQQGLQLTEFVDWKEWMAERKKRLAAMASEDKEATDDEVVVVESATGADDDDANNISNVDDDDEEL